MRTLSLLETRVLGTLYEKQHTVPDSYPLTLNALVAGCNQKTSRSPVMEATESEVQAVLDTLKSANLVIETSGGRVARYSHNVERVLQVPSQSAAILTVLMLRGPQTPGELRINCERLHSFEQRVEQSYQQEARERFSLGKELERLQQLNQRLGEEASARASFYVYTGRDDIDRLAEALNKVERLFARN